ncbi:HET-domain-containing protein, partial [Coniophora puteana RWD-64-598 SS2]
AYATLSHRWGMDEPTYEGYNRIRRGCGADASKMLKRATGPGYGKLFSFLKVARKTGVRFAWSDTCCIDKNSSAELDEAIRSMFRWYRNSSICIVYLAQTQSALDMTKDPWFTRGWTLQELLAPRKIKFMADNCGRSLLFRAVSTGTGIPIDVLTSVFIPSRRRVNEIMSWAAHRRTTRGEDAAYSLVGLFDVSLQTAYGEGAVNAFRRLFEAIARHAEDPSVL